MNEIIEPSLMTKEPKTKRPHLFLADLIEGKSRVLYNFSWGRKKEDNLGALAEKWGYASGGGRFNVHVNELVNDGFLKRFEKGGKRYLKITFKLSLIHI